MIIFGLFLLLFLPCNGQDLRLADLHGRLEAAKEYENYDLSILLEPMASFKQQKFYQHLSSRLAVDIPNINLNITSECEQDLLLIGIAAIDTNNTSPELTAVLSKMMDATAKVPPGIQRGAGNIFGFKQECDIIKYTVPNRKRELTTAYSRAYISISGECSASATSIGFDICMPSSCTSNDLKDVVAISENNFLLKDRVKEL